MEQLKAAMKGQFFLLAAIIFVTILFVSVPISNPLISYQSQDMTFLSRNVQREFPKALNFGLNESGSLQSLINFSGFSRTVVEELFIDFQVLWVVLDGSPSEVNATVGNFLGYDASVALNLSGDVEVLSVPDGETGSYEFASVGQEYNFTITFQGETNNATLARDKVNLYLFTNMTRGKDLITEQIIV